MDNTEGATQINQSQGSILIPRIEPNKDGLSRVFKSPFKKGSLLKSKGFKIIVGVLALFLILCGYLGFTGYRLYTKGVAVKTSLDQLNTSVGNQDLDMIKSGLTDVKSKVSDFSVTFSSLGWLSHFPVVGGYVMDGQRVLSAANSSFDAADILVSAVEPYADIIGFKKGGNQAQSGEETAKDRLDFVIKTVPSLIPAAGKLSEKATQIKTDIDPIDPARYPEEFKGKKIRQNIIKVKELVDELTTLAQNGKPLLEVAPYMLGVDGTRKYLVIFQNDKELRPTGGFITAYSIANVDNGRFEPVLSSDIYNLDETYRPSIPAPDPIVKYLKGPYIISPNFRLRDLNWSPDFEKSMKTFQTEAATVGIKGIDGIISVDTQVLVNILNVIGPVGVPGFGDYSSKTVPECNCPQVIFELESFADIEGPVVWSQDEPGKIIFAPPNYDNRKKIIGPLMNSILANTLGQPKEKVPALFDAIFKSLTEKHILVYLNDDKAQSALNSFGAAGTIKDYSGDYLHINDANLGGRKSNLYVTQEVDQQVDIAGDGTITKTVTITYKNPEKQDGWLNSVLPDWIRVYVPKGSKLISFEGLEEKAQPYEDLGKTVFAGYYTLRPQGIAKLTLKYTLPFKKGKSYDMLIQKQSGTDRPFYSLTIGKFSDEFYLTTDKEVKVNL